MPPPPPPAARPPATPQVVASLPPWEPLAERLDRLRFWVYFSAAVATAAAVLGAIALVVAVTSDDNNSSKANDASVTLLRSQLDGARRDIGTLQTDLTQAQRDAKNAADSSDSLSKRVGKLEKSSTDQKKTADEVTQLRTDLTDLTDRVDQVERAQEDLSGGGP